MSNDDNSDENRDLLEIPCRKCGQKHNYLLDVERSYVVYNLMSTHQMKPVKKTFTRIFICPIKDQEFQVTFSLIQSFGTIIRNVVVKGVKDGGEKETDSEQE